MKTTLTVFAIAVLSASMLSAQSLGEIAAKADAKKAAAAKDGKAEPAKTYTNADLKDVAPLKPMEPVPVKPAADPLPVPQSEASYQGEQINRGEGYWKDRMRVLTTQIDTDTLALQAATDRLTRYLRELEQSRVDVNGIPLVSRTAKIQADFARDEVSRLTATVAADRTAVARLEEEARRANVPPGWLR